MNPNRFLVSVVGFIVVITVAACGGDKGSSTPSAGNPGGGSGSLAGDPTALAVAATTDLGPRAAQATDIVNGVILTKLDVMLAPDAKVGQVNAALVAIGGTIAHMTAGSPFLTVSVPRQADPQALNDLSEFLAAQPGIVGAFPGREGHAKVLPPGEAGGGPDAISRLEHLLPTGFPAAWNAKRLLAGCREKVPVLIADEFGAVENAAAFQAEIPSWQIYGPAPVGAANTQHGYQVATTLAAKFDGTYPTGANPFVDCLDVRLINLDGLTHNEETAVLIHDAFPAMGKFVLNYSYGYLDQCADNDDGDEKCTPDQFGRLIPTAYERAANALLWGNATIKRRDDFLVASAAGNERDKQSTLIYPGLGVATYTSMVNLSALTEEQFLQGMKSSLLWGGVAPYSSLVPTDTQIEALSALIDSGLASAGGRYEASHNVLSVGSTTKHESFWHLTESTFSDRGADVKAVGESVPGIGEEVVDGTSFSAPQVAGLAAYLWLLSPELRSLPAEQTVAAITANTRPNFGSFGGALDAYATVLSLDQEPPSSPVRHAILDVNDDGMFDQLDLQLFADAYHLTAPSLPPPTTRNYSRYDLNGDGFTGGINIDQFDLDRVGSTRFGAAEYSVVGQTIDGFEIHMNEEALSDIDILCYYAYSALYEGDAISRRSVLGTKHCVSAELKATLGGLSGSRATLSVTIKDGMGTPLSGVFVEFSATGGTLSSSSATTDATGTVTALATLDPGSPGITVQVTARVRPGGDVMGETVVEARVGTGVQGCQASGPQLDFTVDVTGGVLFWAADARVNPIDPTTNQSLIKFLMDVPVDPLPVGVSVARVRVAPVASEALPPGARVGTAFQISSLYPADLAGFTPGGQAQPSLTIRYDPAACWIPEDIETELVLGRLNASGAWQEVCGDLADTSLAVRQVSCSVGDLSFGIFGVIRRPVGAPVDVEPPTFPVRALYLSSPARCAASCDPAPWIDLEWGPATDGGGSGVKGYWIYVDGRKVVFTTDITPNPTVRYRLVSSGTVDTTQPHRYQVSAVDNADNESTLFGSLSL